MLKSPYMEGEIMVDNKKIIKCPACGYPMAKVFIKEKNINLDICTQGCGGIYFDNRELEHFSNSQTDITDITNSLSKKDFIEIDTNATRICPVCKAKMVKNFADFDKNITIDECYNCGGKFLDYGELHKIRNSQTKNETFQALQQTVAKGLNNATNMDLQSLFDSLFNDK